MGAHGAIASQGASGIAVARVWKGVIFDLVIPRLYQLKNGSISVNRRQTCSVNSSVHTTAMRASSYRKALSTDLDSF